MAHFPYSGYRGNRRNRKILCSFGTLKFYATYDDTTHIFQPFKFFCYCLVVAAGSKRLKRGVSQQNTGQTPEGCRRNRLVKHLDTFKFLLRF